jgi:SH3 domain-containing YSC84-like protein 1
MIQPAVAAEALSPALVVSPQEQKMKLHRRTVISGTAAALAVPFLTAVPAGADAKRQSLVDSCLETARKVLGGKDFPDAAKLMTNARAVLIIPELVQGGFILGAAGGRGVLMVRTRPKDWSSPAFYGMASGSLGLQIGAKVSEIVFIIRTEKGLNAILDHKFKFGAEAGITLVAVGIGAEGATTTAAGADIVAFSNSVGLFAGASIEGSYLDADNDWNALYYGPGATTKAIVLDRRFTKPGAEPIRQYLAKW